MTKLTITLLALALLIAGFTHGFNMFHFPYFENDEGVYFSQAYAVSQGKLTDYTYWYDHTPIGWIQIAVWMISTGGPFTFGYSLFSARILMLLFHLASSALIFFIVKKLTKKDITSFISVVAYSINFLSVYFQRRLLLDNIMTFWVLLTLFILINSKTKLKWTIAAGISLSIAVLTKETAIVALPIFLVINYTLLHKRQKIIGTIIFILPIILGITYFITYAVLKNELFPSPDHVSLIGTWTYQLTRGNHLPFWKEGSDFLLAFASWIKKDKLYVIAMIATTIWTLIGFRKNLLIRLVGLLGLSFWIFMLRGGLIIDFYVIPLLALGAITIGIVAGDILKIRYTGFLIIIFLLGLYLFNTNYSAWTNDETTPQIESVNWVKKHLPKNANIAVDDSQLLDLRLSRFNGDPSFPNTHWFFKLEKDPTIKRDYLANDWQNLDYLIASNELIKQMHEENLPFLKPVINHSTELISWNPISPTTYINIDKLISTNGDWAKIYKVLDRNDIILLDSWRSYVNNFIKDGQVFDWDRGITTSEGQAYALLRSVVENDKPTFDSVWMWTKWHMQFRNEDKLFSWKWEGDSKTGKLRDSSPASDADIDIATALILAGKKWSNQKYEEVAKEIINDIWKQEVMKLGDGKLYLIAGTWAQYGDSITVNPSYISPASFRIFSEVDKNHDWKKLINDSYYLLNKSSDLNTDGLPPDWITINKTTQQLSPSKEQNLSNNFGYDAMRVYFRIAQDTIWNNSPQALSYLQSHNFLINYSKQNSKIPDGFNTKGIPVTNYENNAFYGALLPYLKIVDSAIYQEIKDKLQNQYTNGEWKENNSYYTQNWVWFGIALSENKFSN